jgi:cytochrome c
MYKLVNATALLLGLLAASLPAQSAEPGYYGYGKPATESEIAGWDIDIRPDGKGLPEGSGSVEDGEWVYEEKCAECHGSFGEGVGRYPALAGGEGTLTDDRPHKTVGSFWPHASTLWDYIHRAMPYTAPESLEDDEVYALVAYVLYLNDLVEDDFVLDRETFSDVVLPNNPNFIRDNRPDTANTRCMNNCKNPANIEILSMVEPTAVEPQTVAIPSPAEHPGRSTYQQACALCHDAGLAGAPVLGDKPIWQIRSEKGMSLLIDNAINGYTGDTGMMPPKGGFLGLSDAAVGAAVEYMLEQSQ